MYIGRNEYMFGFSEYLLNGNRFDFEVYSFYNVIVYEYFLFVYKFQYLFLQLSCEFFISI